MTKLQDTTPRIIVRGVKFDRIMLRHALVDIEESRADYDNEAHYQREHRLYGNALEELEKRCKR